MISMGVLQWKMGELYMKDEDFTMGKNSQLFEILGTNFILKFIIL